MITESEKDIFDLEQIYNIMIHDMADRLTTDYHSQSWVINYYFQQAKNKLNNKGGKPVMKVMISQPMSGIPDAEVRRIQSELRERFAKYHIEVVDSFLTEEIKDSNHPGVYYLGRTLTNFLHKVDAVYFVHGWELARGCRIEREICREYGIMILDDTFFKQENEVHVKRQFGSDKVRFMPCKNEDQLGPDIMKHIPQLEGLEEE